MLCLLFHEKSNRTENLDRWGHKKKTSNVYIKGSHKPEMSPHKANFLFRQDYT